MSRVLLSMEGKVFTHCIVLEFHNELFGENESATFFFFNQ